MPKTIVLEITHPAQAAGRVSGFRFLWAHYVDGYRSDRHCQRCFYGKLVPDFSPKTESVGSSIALDQMDRYPYVYICGVSSGAISKRGERNLHLPLRYEEGAVVTMATYNDYALTARNAACVPVAALDDDWRRLAREHARCKNFQFAVAAFGYPAAPRRARLPT